MSKLTEKKIIEIAKVYLKGWFTPIPPVTCLRCKSTYETGYCLELSPDVYICKGCNEAPLWND